MCIFSKIFQTLIMNKAAFPISILALIFAIFSFFYLKNNSELVYVDVNKLLDGYQRTAIVKKDFEKKEKASKANIDSLLGNWQNELKIYEKERASMSEKELELKQQLLANKQQQINNYQKAIQNQLSQEDQKITQTVVNDINDYIKEYGETHNYNIIFGASGGGNIMYAKKGSDLTAEILKGLNEEFEGK